MRILYLTGDVVEHTSDLLYNGLVEWYGHDNVIDFPYRNWHHVKDLKETIGNSYIYWCSTIDKNVDSRHQYNFEEIVQMINNGFFDIMIVSVRAWDIFYKLKSCTRRIGTILVNGEDFTDESYISHIIPRFSSYWNEIDMILQREYKLNTKDKLGLDNRAIPFQFSCPTSNLVALGNFDYKKDKEIDVFCCLGDTHPFRKKLREKVSEISIKLGAKSIVTNNHFSIYEYFKHMNNSKISIVAGGRGWETTHYTDIPFAKSMLLAQHPSCAVDSTTLKESQTLYVNNFKNKYSAVFYNNDLNDLEQLIKYYLDHNNEREEITIKGYEHLINNLTTKCMAEYFVRCWYNRDYWKPLV